MLSNEENEILTRVGPGTLMGNLLRRYWTPALLSEELPDADCPPIRVRLLGEDLVAFRDTAGQVGLVANACPHRGASMFFGRNEETGLRCVYHGWKFDIEGTCVDMPSEPAESNFKSKVRITAYPTHESGGIVWTYMGPSATMTGFRDFGSDSLSKEEWRATKILSTCNWVQGLEGNIDSAHISFLHRNLVDFGLEADDTDRPGSPSDQMSRVIRASDKAARLEVYDTWYGFRYAGVRLTPAGHTHVRITDYMLPYLCYIAAIPVGGDGGTMMVPIDDHSFWRYGIAMANSDSLASVRPAPASFRAAAPQQRRSGVQERTQWASNDYLIDREAQRTLSFTGIIGVPQQDMAVTESMGTIYDRGHEHLGTSDRAVIRMRRMLIKAAQDLAAGEEPLAVDPSLPFDRIRSAERILAPGEDWRTLGTDADPVVDKLTAQIAT